MAKTVPLKIAVADNPHTLAVKSGAFPIEGVAPEFITIVPQIAAFRRMVRGLEFDVCELAPTTYLIARALGAPYVALPIFLMRAFHHSGFLVRPEANIRHPKDLEGKKVGVRAYSVTTGVWTRQIFMDEYGLDSSKVTWVVDDEEHVEALKLPPNVVHTAPDKSLAGMMAAGELDAGLAGNAGIGRSGGPQSGTWKQEKQDYPEMFPNARELETEWYKRTGIYPMHGTIVVKEDVLRANPWIARSIYDAFLQAKNEWLTRLPTLETATDKKYRELSKIVGDPMPYGMAANMPAIEALIDTAFKTGLTNRRLSVAEAFVDPER